MFLFSFVLKNGILVDLRLSTFIEKLKVNESAARLLCNWCTFFGGSRTKICQLATLSLKLFFDNSRIVCVTVSNFSLEKNNKFFHISITITLVKKKKNKCLFKWSRPLLFWSTLQKHNIISEWKTYRLNFILFLIDGGHRHRTEFAHIFCMFSDHNFAWLCS